MKLSFEAVNYLLNLQVINLRVHNISVASFTLLKQTELTKLAAFRPRSYRLSNALRSDDTRGCNHQHSFVEPKAITPNAVITSITSSETITPKY